MLYVVGIGPGNPLDRTRRAEQAIGRSGVVAGYHVYLDLIRDLTAGKEIIATGMRREVERCEIALRRAAEGATVAVVSSGDPGVYGMAGLVIEQAQRLGIDVPIEVVPGVSACFAAAARLGAPLMLDFACISLSDLLVGWEQILERLDAVARAGLVAALYNPRSRRRIRQLEEAAAVFRRYREPSTPVGIATAVGLEDEHVVISDLGNFLSAEIGMRSIVLIGCPGTRVVSGRLVTPRGYRL
jgi:precorrin-3B C17-methyltransferase